MFPYKASLRFSPVCWKVVRRFSDQKLVVVKKSGTSLKVVKKPNRPPFMKNVFAGIFDKEMLTYPELDKESLEDLKKAVKPYQHFFENVDPKVIDSIQTIPSEYINSLKNLGLFGQIIPSLYGGNEHSATETALISEIAAKDLDVALMLYSHNFLAVQSLVMYGTQQQKEKYLPRLASGEWLAALCLSESTGSSDPTVISTTAINSDDNPENYLVNGKKQWVINGYNSNLFIVSVNTKTKCYTGEEVTALRYVAIEKDSPGVVVSKELQHVGLNACNICEVTFKDTPVHIHSFIGPEFKGLEIFHTILNSGRFNVGAMTVSVLKNLLNKATEFILQRQDQFNQPLRESEIIQEKLSEAASCIYTLESMIYLTTGILDQYENPDCLLELAIIKVFSFTEGRRCLDLLMELMGGRAYMNTEIIQKYFRDFRTLEVFDGTINIAKLFITLTGLVYSGEVVNELVSKLRYPYEYPFLILKQFITHRGQINDKGKLNLKLYEQLHPSLQSSADELEYCVLRFHYAVQVLFTRYGPDIVHQQIELSRLADAAVRIYAMTAVLGRSSRSYCIGLNNGEFELKCAMRICSAYHRIVRTELNDAIDSMVISGDFFSLNIGSHIFTNHGYFLEKPIERSY